MNKLTLLALSSCVIFATAGVSAKSEDVVVHAAEVTGANAPGINERINNGKQLFSVHCAACHRVSGKGLPGAFPPLAESDYNRR